MRTYLIEKIQTNNNAGAGLLAVHEKKIKKKVKSSVIDTVSALGISNYLEKQKEQQRYLIQKLDNIKDEKIVLWGISARMMYILATIIICCNLRQHEEEIENHIVSSGLKNRIEVI